VNILALDDLFYTHGPLLNYVPGHHVVSVISAITMTAVAIIALSFRSARKRFFLSWDAMTIDALYGLIAFCCFQVLNTMQMGVM
jgi:cation:H+ antiporter